MKILLIGDPHLKISNLALAKAFLNWTNGIILEVKPDKVVNLGDTFDTHAVIRSELLSEFKKHLNLVTPHCEYIYVLGNHDMFKPNDNTYHALQSFSGHYENLTVIESMTNRQDLGITFVPFLPNHASFPTETLPICIAHQTFVGCDFGGYRPEDGVDPDKISAEIIISGHIHKKQSFGKVFYPGSPYSQNMKDIGQLKGLHLFDTETYKIEWINCPLPSWLRIDVDLSEIKEPIGYVRSLVSNSNDNFVVVSTGPRKEISSVLESKKWKELCEKSKISTRTKYIDSNRVERIKIKAHTVTDVVEEYIDNVYSGGVDKGLIKKTMRQLFDNVDKNNV